MKMKDELCELPELPDDLVAHCVAKNDEALREYQSKAEPPEQLTHQEDMLIKPQNVNTPKASPSLEDEVTTMLYELSEMRDFSRDKQEFSDKVEAWLNAKLKAFDARQSALSVEAAAKELETK